MHNFFSPLYAVCVCLLKYYQHLPALVVIISDRLGNITVEQLSGVKKKQKKKTYQK